MAIWGFVNFRLFFSARRQIMDKVTEIYAKVVKSANIKPE